MAGLSALAAASGPLEELFSPLAGKDVWCVSCDHQMYDNINKWLRGSGASRELVEGESCTLSFGKVLCPTCCQALAGEYSLLVESKELPLPPLPIKCCKSSPFPKQKHEKGNAEILWLFPRGGKRFGGWMWLPLLFLFSFFSKSLLCGKTMVGAQPPSSRGGVRAESGVAAGRCRCFIHTQLED